MNVVQTLLIEANNFSIEQHDIDKPNKGKKEYLTKSFSTYFWSSFVNDATMNLMNISYGNFE